MNSIPIEIERKYIIRIPDEEAMRSSLGYTCSEIVQIYLNSAPGVTHRVRERKTDGKSVYTETKKIRIDKMSAFEDEKNIDEREFQNLSKNVKKGTVPVRKVRHTFLHLEKTIEIDVYPQWKNTSIMEVELTSREEEIKLPPFIEIIKEVTGEKAYSNASMAMSFPGEII